MRKNLDTKYENADLNKVMTKLIQNLSAINIEIIKAPLKIFEDIFYGMLGKWNIKLVGL